MKAEKPKRKRRKSGGAVEGGETKPRLDRRARGGSGIHIKPSHEGLLHKNLGVAKDQPIPAAKLEKAENSDSAAVRKRAVFAANAKTWNK